MNRISSSCLLAVLMLTACASPTPLHRAPVVDGVPGRSVESAATGVYVVKPGDTLYGIALEHGMDWRELARINQIDDPTKLPVGARLKVDANSGPSAQAEAPARGSASGSADSAVVEVTPVQPAGVAKTGPAKPVPLGNADAAAAGKEAAKEPAKEAAGSGDFMWPHPGSIIQAYKAGVNKGIDLAAKVGDPVYAAAPGKVVYSGNALRGYGNLVIVRHENKLLTAYAHNKTLLVKEGELVKKGQKIAEAGQSDTDKPKVHFEVRKNGNPVDPLDYLPAR